MNSRERVLKVFNHEIPDRVPMWCGASPELIEKARKILGVEDVEAVYKRFGDDFRRILPEYIDAHWELANAYLRAGDSDSALIHFRVLVDKEKNTERSREASEYIELFN